MICGKNSRNLSLIDLLKIHQRRNQQERILEIADDECLSAARAALRSKQLAEPNKENLKKHLEKHPQENIPEDIPSSHDCEWIQILKAIVLKKLKSFPNHTASGPTGT